ncbi:putative Ig domain-containing protein [Dactylosporangium sp. NPDC049742]|uniref:putative Ig domain-containing protein n=1 Tax=Dactylosporangium sp. NPDC049742 TaxID=3154737 RepID=UPI003438F366
MDRPAGRRNDRGDGRAGCLAGAADRAVRRGVGRGGRGERADPGAARRAAGGNACNYGPGGQIPEGVQVGNATSGDTKAGDSNYGTCMDLFAPGSNVLSAYHTSDTASTTMSGTSMAAPHVAGAVATYLTGHPSATPAQVHAWVTDNASTGKMFGLPAGTPNKLLYVPAAAGPPPTGDYTLSASPASATVQAGGSATSTIAATATGTAVPSVVGGQPTTVEQHPFMISQRREGSSFPGQQSCSSTLMGPHTVYTVYTRVSTYAAEIAAQLPGGNPPPGSDITLSATGLPSGATASFSPGTVSTGGTATLTVTTSAGTPAGTYPITVTGTKGSTTAQTTFTLTVQGGGTPGPLALTNPGTQNSVAGRPAALTLRAQGGTTPYRFTASVLPAGLTLNPSTGVVSGTPTTFQTSNVTVTVTDAAGRTARATFFWFVMPF